MEKKTKKTYKPHELNNFGDALKASPKFGSFIAQMKKKAAKRKTRKRGEYHGKETLSPSGRTQTH